MKRFKFFSIVYLLPLSVFCQTVLFFEDFDNSNTFPSDWLINSNNVGNFDWRILNDDWSERSFSPPNCAFMPGESLPGGGVMHDWLVTPQIHLNNSQYIYLTFYGKQSSNNNLGSTYEIKISTTSQSDMNSFTSIATWSESEFSNGRNWGQKFLDLSSYSGQDIYLAFILRTNSGDHFYLDNVEIKAFESVLPELDLIYFSTDKTHLVDENADLIFKIHNNGNAIIESFDINCIIGENVFSQTISTEILPFGENTFSIENAWNSSVLGYNNLEVYVDNILSNGGNDYNLSNNSKSTSILVGSQEILRVPLYEEFSSSTCPPCFSINTYTFNQNYLNSLSADFNLIKYQMPWPSPGDPYSNSFGSLRRNFYDIHAVPDILLDGENNLEFPYDLNELSDDFYQKLSIPSFFLINANHSIDDYMISLTTDVMPYTTGNFTVYVAVVEQTTTGNIGTNGETQFYNVNMIGSWMDTNFVDNIPIEIYWTFDMSQTNVEEMDDLQIVVFIQNQDTKEIMQSAISSLSTLGISEQNFLNDDLFFVPNPTKDNLIFFTKNKIEVRIFNSEGQMVFNKKDIVNEREIDVSILSTGVYYVQMISAEINKTEKLIIN